MIVLKTNYRGRPTQDRLIKPGKYAPDDPALFGCAEYLLANGFAALEPDAPKKSAPVPPVVLTAPTAPVSADPPSIGTPEPIEIPSIGDAPILPIPYAEWDMELLRAEIAKRGLGDTVVATGKHNNVLKADLIKALEDAAS